jgi:MFS family permease
LAADIVNRKKLIFGVHLILMFVSFSLTVSTFNHTVSPLLIYGLIALNAAALSFSGRHANPCFRTSCPGAFHAGGRLNSLMWQTAMIIGPSLAGFIIGAWGIGYVYLISIFTVLAVNIAILFMKPHKNENKGTEFSFRSIRSGLGFVKRTPLIWSTMFLDFFATFFASSTALMPIFAKDILKVGPFGLGLLYAAPALGALIAGFTFASLHNIAKQGRILLGSVVIYGIATILFGFSRIFPLSLACLFFVGAGDTVSSIIRNTMRQLITPDHLRGRMVSVNMIFTGRASAGGGGGGDSRSAFGNSPFGRIRRHRHHRGDTHYGLRGPDAQEIRHAYGNDLKKGLEIYFVCVIINF